MKNKGFANTLLIIFVVGVFGILLYGVLNKEQPRREEKAPQSFVSGQATYANLKYGFELQYPSSWNAKNGIISFATKNGYGAAFGVEDVTPTTKYLTIAQMREEYDRAVASNPDAPRAVQVLKDITIGDEPGLEWAGIGCEQGNPCHAKYEFYSNSTLRKGFKFYLVIPNLKNSDVSASYDPRPLFTDGVAIVRGMLLTFKFVH